MEELKRPLEKVEELISLGELDEAQKLLDEVKVQSARKFFVQSLIYEKRGWSRLQRWQLEYAVKAEPQNPVYKEQLQKFVDAEKELTLEERLFNVEKAIELSEIKLAQDELDSIEEDGGKKRYLQSRIFKAKKWYNEQRKQLKSAIELDPENEQYKQELSELEQFSKTKEYKRAVRKRQMGKVGSFCRNGCLGCLACICEGIGYC